MDALALSKWTKIAEQARATQSTEGIIAIGKATRDQEQVSRDDLMFLQGDEVVVLRKLSNGRYLGYCEGVVGSFDQSAVDFQLPPPSQRSDNAKLRDYHVPANDLRQSFESGTGLGIITGSSPRRKDSMRRRLRSGSDSTGSPTSPVSVSGVDFATRIVDSPSSTARTTPSLMSSPSTDLDNSSQENAESVSRAPLHLDPLARRKEVLPEQAQTVERLEGMEQLQRPRLGARLDSETFRPSKMSNGSSDSEGRTPSSDDRTLSIIFDSYRYSMASPSPPLLRHDSSESTKLPSVASTYNPSRGDSPVSDFRPSPTFGAASNLRNRLEAQATVSPDAAQPQEVNDAPNVAHRHSAEENLSASIPRLSEIFPRSGTMDSLASVQVPITPSPTTTRFPMHEPNHELEAARALFSVHFKGPVSASALPQPPSTFMQGSPNASTFVLPDAPVAKHRSLSTRRKSVKGLTISSPIIPGASPSFSGGSPALSSPYISSPLIPLPSSPHIDVKAPAKQAERKNVASERNTVDTIEEHSSLRTSAVPIIATRAAATEASRRSGDSSRRPILESAVPLTSPSSSSRRPSGDQSTSSHTSHSTIQDLAQEFAPAPHPFGSRDQNMLRSPQQPRWPDDKPGKEVNKPTTKGGILSSLRKGSSLTKDKSKAAISPAGISSAEVMVKQEPETVLSGGIEFDLIEDDDEEDDVIAELPNHQPPTLSSNGRRPLRPISVITPLDEGEVEDYRAKELQWIKVLSSPANTGQVIKQSKKLRNLVLQGVPSSVRARVWARLTASDDLVVPGLYQSLCEQASNGLDERIENDVQELTVDYPRLADDDATRSELASVVKALVRYDRELRYSTTLIFLAGILLSQFAVGEPTFWTTVAILNNVGYRKHFTRLKSDQYNVRTSTLAFGFMLEQVLAQIAKRFVSCQIDPSIFYPQWTSTMFVTILPWSSCLRIIDLLLLDSQTFNVLTSLSVLKIMALEDESLFPDRKSLLQMIRSAPSHLFKVSRLLALVMSFVGAPPSNSNVTMKGSITKIKATAIEKAYKKAKMTIEEMDARS